MDNYMITGSWDDVTLVCGHRHKEPIPMVIQNGPSSPFYACPKYREENREPGERACNNRLSFQDYTTMLNHLHKLLIEAELADEQINLLHYKWKDRKGTEFQVLEQNGRHLVIQVYNKKAINS